MIIKSKICNDCGHITGTFNKKCLECGGSNLATYYNHIPASE